MGHLHEGLSLRLDSFDGSRLGELELHLGFAERKVGASLGVSLDIFVQVSLKKV